MVLMYILIFFVLLFIFYLILNRFDKYKLNKLRRNYELIEGNTEKISREQGFDIESARRIAESELSIEGKFGTGFGTDKPVKPKRRGLFQSKSIISPKGNIDFPVEYSGKDGKKEYTAEREQGRDGNNIQAIMSENKVTSFIESIKEKDFIKDGDEKRKPRRKTK